MPRSTLSDANEIKDWRIYADFAGILAAEARILYKTDNDFLLDLEKMVYAFDSTTIDLCLNLFPWAKFRQNKGAVKMPWSTHEELKNWQAINKLVGDINSLFR